MEVVQNPLSPLFFDMIYSPETHKETSGIYYTDYDESAKKKVLREITVVYGYIDGQLRILWEKLMGYLFDSDDYALMDSEGYILKAEDQ